MAEVYNNEDIILWPECSIPPEAALEELYVILNSPTHIGAVSGEWNEPSLVLNTSSTDDGLKALMFISFDPIIHLQGLKQYPTASRYSDTPREHQEYESNHGVSNTEQGSHLARRIFQPVMY